MLRNTLNTFISATLIMLLGVSSSAKAIVPAGNLMGSTSVTWGGETASEIQTSIQSILVPAAPTLSGPDNQTRIPADKPSVTLEYTITSNANGEDTYSLSSAAAPEGVEATGSTAPSPASVPLGATAAMEAADAGEDAIKVPSDGVIDDAVNGITNGDTVFINKNEYTVGAVVDDGNTATITLTSGLQAPLAFGDRIAERETFEVTLDNVGTITEGVDTSTVTITVTATSTSPGAPTADDDVVLTLLTPVGPSVEKYVRNVTLENDRNPPDNLEWVEEGFAYEYPSGSETFYFRSQLNDGTPKDEALVNAEEDDILEYLIVLKAGNQGEQSNITLNESLPPFASYLPASAKINNESIEDNDDDNSPVLTEDWTVTNAKGPLTIDTNGLAYITYKVTVIGGEGEGDAVLNLSDATAKVDCQGGGAFKPGDWSECEGKKWNAAKGIDPINNPVCWSKEVQYGSGENPWVVGTTRPSPTADTYDCRTKCADKSGESFGHCAVDPWWNMGAARSIVCEFDGGSVLLRDLALSNYLNDWAPKYRRCL